MLGAHCALHFKLKGDAHPVQMPVHRVPVTKRVKEKHAIDNYVREGILKKVDEPTPWCSNELIRETPKKFRVCIDPSQTINKVIERPIYQMPTLPEHLHKLSNVMQNVSHWLMYGKDSSTFHLMTIHPSLPPCTRPTDDTDGLVYHSALMLLQKNFR